MKAFLTAKPIAIFLGLMISGLIFLFINNTLQFSDNPESIVRIYPYILPLLGLVLVLWLFSIGTQLKKILPNNVQMEYKPTWFYIGLVIIIFSNIAIAFPLADFMKFVFEDSSSYSSSLGPSINDGLREVGIFGLKLFAIGIFTIFGNILVINHCAGITKAVQTGQVEKYSTSKLEFWMFMIPVIGVWINQPKINAAMNGEYPWQRNSNSIVKEMDDSLEVLD